MTQAAPRVPTVGLPATQLPVSKLRSLLDQRGIEETWKTLIFTLAESHESSVSASSEFSHIQEHSENILHGLSVGNISVLYEYSLAYTDTGSRKAAGQFFTPDDVASALAELSKDFPNEEAVWLDPCSGVGNLSYHLASKQRNPNEFLENRLKVVDKDPLALLIARALLTIAFEPHKSSGMFDSIKKNFHHQDFLELETPLPEHDYIIMNPPYVVVPADERFSTAPCRDLYAYFIERASQHSQGFISINPQSFTHSEKFRTLRKLLEEHYTNVSIYSFDNFPDNVFRGVKFGSKNTNTANSIRPSIVTALKKPLPASSATQDCVSEYPPAPSEKTAQGRVWHISPLLRWRSADRSRMLKDYTTLTGEFQPDFGTGNPYPKLQPSASEFYNSVKLLPSAVSSITVPDSRGRGNPLQATSSQPFGENTLFGAFGISRASQGSSNAIPSTALSSETSQEGVIEELFLNVPTTSRYFIPATKRTLDRASFTVLGFSNEKDRNLAYLLLNSSYLFWWWRIFDGGMTVSRSLIQSLPIPDPETDATSGIRKFLNFSSIPELLESSETQEVIAALEESEEKNLVVKLNSGRNNENVKHPTELIDKVNKLLYVPEVAETLLKNHSNNSLE